MIEYNLNIMILDNPLNMPWFIREFILFYGGIEVLFDDMEGGFQAELHRRLLRGEGDELAFRKARQMTNELMMYLAREAGFWDSTVIGSYPDVMLLDNPLNMPWYLREFIMWYGGIDVLFEDLEDGFQAELHRRLRRGEEEKIAFRKARQTTNRQIMDMAREEGFWHNIFGDATNKDDTSSSPQTYNHQTPNQAIYFDVRENELRENDCTTSSVIDNAETSLKKLLTASCPTQPAFQTQSSVVPEVRESRAFPLATTVPSAALCIIDVPRAYRYTIATCLNTLALLRIRSSHELNYNSVDAKTTGPTLVEVTESHDGIITTIQLQDGLPKGPRVILGNEITAFCNMNPVDMCHFARSFRSAHDTQYLSITDQDKTEVMKCSGVSMHGQNMYAISCSAQYQQQIHSFALCTMLYLPALVHARFLGIRAQQNPYAIPVLHEQKKAVCVTMQKVTQSEYMYNEQSSAKHSIVSAEDCKEDVTGAVEHIKDHCLDNGATACHGKNGKKKGKSLGSRIRNFFRSLCVCGRKNDIDH